MPTIPIGLSELRAAATRIADHVECTPVRRSAVLDDLVGAECFLKLENLQVAGAFKSRGACNVVFSLEDGEAQRGVVTHSSGNHAAALARAAQRRGIPAYVVMPKDAPDVKVANVRSFGARITFCEPTLEARETTAMKVRQETGAEFVHPYDDWRIVAGAGTGALELIEEVDRLDLVIAPVGGGGLLSGTAVASHALIGPGAVYGAEPVAADDAWQSLRSGRRILQTAPNTQADGLRTSLGERNWQVISALVPRILLAGDTAADRWARQLSAELDCPIEISSGVAVAALVDARAELRGRRIGIIISGGNVSQP